MIFEENVADEPFDMQSINVYERRTRINQTTSDPMYVCVCNDANPAQILPLVHLQKWPWNTETVLIALHFANCP